MYRKNNSRNSDRVRIKKLHAQGFSVDQIVGTVNIHEEHVRYVLEKYEVDLAKHKRKEKELETFRAAELLGQQQMAGKFAPANPMPDLTALRAEIEAKVRAELAEQEEDDVGEEIDTAETENEEASPEKTRRRKKRQRRAA